MNNEYKKKDFEHMANKRRNALSVIADKLGKEHTITKMMGGMAWGRNNPEPHPGYGAKDAIRGMGYLDGSFHILNIWARDNDRTAQKIMLAIYPMKWESAK
jgi:hypothetical protein